jgi:hypothetical protein
LKCAETFAIDTKSITMQITVINYAFIGKDGMCVWKTMCRHMTLCPNKNTIIE